MIQILLDSFNVIVNTVNTWIWVISNILIFLVFISAGFFSLGYPLLFKIETTGGWRLWRAILSIAGFGLLSVLGTYVDPQGAPWWALPPGIAWWRPVIRLAVFALVSLSFASLAAYLIQRRFFTSKLKIRPEIVTLLEAELRTHYGSGTGMTDPHVVAMELIESGWTRSGYIQLGETLGAQPRSLPVRHKP